MTATTRIRWLDLIDPSDTEYTAGAPSVETRLLAYQWLTARAAHHRALEAVRIARYVPGDGYDLPALTTDYFNEVRSVFARLLLARRPASWLTRERVTLTEVRRLPFRSYVGGDDEICCLLSGAFALAGQRTVYAWNPIHPQARDVDEVFLRATPDGWAWHLQYGYDGSSWARWFESKRGESLRAFLRRWAAKKMLAAPPARDGGDYRRSMGGAGGGPSWTAMRWRRSSGPEHVHFDTTVDPAVFRCTSCGAEQAQPVPVPSEELETNLRRFDELHWRCPWRERAPR